MKNTLENMRLYNVMDIENGEILFQSPSPEAVVQFCTEEDWFMLPQPKGCPFTGQIWPENDELNQWVYVTCYPVSPEPQPTTKLASVATTDLVTLHARIPGVLTDFVGEHTDYENVSQDAFCDAIQANKQGHMLTDNDEWDDYEDSQNPMMPSELNPLVKMRVKWFCSKEGFPAFLAEKLIQSGREEMAEDMKEELRIGSSGEWSYAVNKIKCQIWPVNVKVWYLQNEE